MVKIGDRIHGCDVGRGVVIGYTEDIGWWAYVENPNLYRRLIKGKTKYITKAKTVRITRGNRVVETHRNVRIPVKAVRLVQELSEVIKPGDVVVMERTGANGLRYARLLQKEGVRVYFVDGKEFNRFMLSFGGKDDFSDARGLYTYAYLYALQRSGQLEHLSPLLQGVKEYRLYKLINVEVKLRYLINAYRRADKDLTNAINRLKDHLTAFLPDPAPFRTREYLLRHLDDFPTMIDDPDYRAIVEYEIRRIKEARQHKEGMLRRIKELLQIFYPEEYNLLKTIPHISDIQIAVIMAYGGIRVVEKMIRTRDEYIGYSLEGRRRAQSGKTDNNRKDKVRREVLHVFYMMYLVAHQEKSPLYPLVEYLKVATYGGDIAKKRYRKFVDKILEIARLMLKHRVDFERAIYLRVRRLETQIKQQYDKYGTWELMSQRRVREIYHMAVSLKAYWGILKETGREEVKRIIEEALKRA